MPRIMMFKYVDRLRLPIRHQFLLFSTTKGAIQTKPVLTLLEEEKDFFDILKRVVRDNNLNSTIRVAGGWVRDRLMGRPSKYDIDLAVDNLTGVQFMKEMNDWMTHQGSSTYKFSIIALNPEKSKHLETVQLSYGKLKVDIVHLRTEEYSETSRVPVIALGTPMEDAYRRDLTINSLFYNINTEEIEDLTERGLVDLSEHVIRTPLPPLVTFTDDPLRALRAIRFACRFNFHIDKDLLDACSQENVRKLLGEKVSRERIRSEMDLILETHYSHRAFYLLYHTGLLQVIIPPLHQLHQKYDFHLIEFNFVPPKIDEELSSRIYAEGCFSVLLAHRLFQLLRSSSSSSSTYPEELRASLFGDVLQKVTPGFIHTNLLYLLLSLSSQGWKSQKKPFHSAPVLLLVDGIRLKNKEMAAMTQLLSALSVLNLIFDKLEGTAAVDSPRDTSISPAVKQLFDSDLQSRCYGPISRLELGSLMLQLDDGFFEASLILTVISRICFKLKQQQNWMKKDFDEGSLLLGRILNLSDEGRAVEEITLRLKKENNQHRLTEGLVESLLSEEMHTMLEVLKAAKDLDLQDVKDLKLFFSGTEIMEIFPHIQGKAVKEFKDLQQRWMLCHPQGSRTDVELFLREYVTRRSSS